jgi:hypothetical protein
VEYLPFAKQDSPSQLLEKRDATLPLQHRSPPVAFPAHGQEAYYGEKMNLYEYEKK